MYDSNIKQDTGGEFVSEGMFFPEQPCYHIEILEWIDKEDITDEWRYVWMYDPPEPVYSVTPEEAEAQARYPVSLEIFIMWLSTALSPLSK